MTLYGGEAACSILISIRIFAMEKTFSLYSLCCSSSDDIDKKKKRCIYIICLASSPPTPWELYIQFTSHVYRKSIFLLLLQKECLVARQASTRACVF